MKPKFQRALTCLLTILLLTSPAYSISFPDVDENSDYAEAVDYLSDIGIFSGDDKGNFNPDSTVTRAEMAALICRMLGETENLSTSTDFIDVPADHWANAYVGKVAELGIVNGYGNGKFGPSDNVTYEQAVTMLVRATELEEFAIKAGGYPDGFIQVAKDCGYISRISANIGEPLVRWKVAQIFYNVT